MSYGSSGGYDIAFLSDKTFGFDLMLILPDGVSFSMYLD